MTPTECPDCGREISHYQDCPAMRALRAAGATVLLDDHKLMPAPDPGPDDGDGEGDEGAFEGPSEEERKLSKENARLQNLSDEELKAEISNFRPCAFGECQNEVIGDKRVKYCEDHRDIKNRSRT